MRAGDYELYLTLNDQASAPMRQAMDGMTASTQKHGKEVSRLTQFYREQRAEQRMMNFYFREGRQVIGAMSLGLSGMSAIVSQSDSSMKKLNQSLMQGFMAFQGVEFALSALGAGPWGVIIGGIVGIGTAIAGLSDNSDELKKIIELKDRLFESKMALGGPVDFDKLEYYTKRRIQAEKALQDLFDKGGWTKEKELLLQIEINGWEKKRLDLWRKITDEIGKDRKEQEKSIDRDVRRQIELFDAKTRAQKPSILGTYGMPLPFVNEPIPVKLSAEELDIGREMRERLEEQLDVMGSTVENVAGFIGDTMRGAADVIVDAFFGASKSIEQFFTSMIKRIAAMMIEELVLKGIMTAIMGLFSGGMSPAIEAATNRLQRLGGNVAGRQRIVEAIDEANYRGKG